METPTTELEALNLLLQAVGEAPVSSYDTSTGEDAVSARSMLESVSRAVQKEGYEFNEEVDYPLTRDLSGRIDTPGNTLAASFPMEQPGSITVRGNKVYDKSNHSYVFDRNICADLVLYLPFDDLPETARHYITYRAARKFEQVSFGNPEQGNYNLRDERAAYIEFIGEMALQANKKLKV